MKVTGTARPFAYVPLECRGHKYERGSHNYFRFADANRSGSASLKPTSSQDTCFCVPHAMASAGPVSKTCLEGALDRPWTVTAYPTTVARSMC